MDLRRRTLPWIATGLVFLALPTVAQAAQFCVGTTGTTCDGGQYAFDAAGLQAALTDAKARSGRDEVRLAAGRLAGLPPLTVSDPSGVQLVGAGSQRTTLEANAGAGNAITWQSYQSTATDLRLTGAGSTGILVDAPGGLFSSGPTFERLHIDGYTRGISVKNAAGLGGIVVRDSVIDLGGLTSGRGVLVTGGGAIFTLSRLTIAGHGTAQIGVEAATSTSGQVAVGGVDGSLITLSGSQAHSFSCAHGAGNAEITAATTAFDQSPTYSQAGSGTGCALPAPTSAIDLGPATIAYVSQGTGDFHLAYYSDLIDKGAATAPAGTLDADGLPRLVDGNGDGTTALDFGAYEYQRRPPSPVTIATSGGDTTVEPGAAVQFSASATDPDPGEFVSYLWDFGDGQTATTPFPTHTFGALGTFTVTATAKDPTGLSTSAQLTITVANAPIPATPTPVPTPTVDPFATATGPRVRVLTAPSAKVQRGQAGFSTPLTGAPDTATLETAGAVTLRVALARAAKGRLNKSTCKVGARRGKRCTARCP